MSWQVLTFAGLAAVLIGGFGWYERTRPPARLVALVAALAALAVAGRLVLAPIPNVVATTDIALITGFALGPAPGFAVGALAAPVSNIWLGQGPWTVWQMVGWGLVGLAGAWLALVTGRRLGRFGLAAACGVAGLAYGALLDLSVMVTYGGEQSLDRYFALSARGVPFNVAHALGNVAFALAAGPALVRMISRYRTRLQFTWRPAGALPLALLAVLLLTSSSSDPPAADAKRSKQAAGAPSTSAERWLLGEQNGDGGFAASPEYASSPAMTGWAMLGLEASGRNPLDVAKGENTPVSYLRDQIDRLRSVNDLERTILALEGAGVDSRDFAGHDLVAELRSRRESDGSVSGQANLTAFFVLAMRAGGSDRNEVGRSAGWLREAQNRDGGWGINPAAASDPDSTGAALQALAVAGAPGDAAAGGVRWLRQVQRGGGGWGFNTTGVVNAQSTAWAVQGLVASGSGGAALGDGLGYLGRLQAADGHYTYSSSSDQMPVWVTAQAMVALARQPLPLGAVPRRPASPAEPSAPAEVAGDDSTESARAPTTDRGVSPTSRERSGSGDDDGKHRSGRREGEEGTGTRSPHDREADSREPAAPPAATASAAAASAPLAAPATGEGGSAAAYVAADLAVLAALGAALLWYRRRAA